MKKPSYKRQKALLALLDTFDGQLSKTDLQKYMFLYVKEFSENEHYAFVPYHYGSFSYELYKDVHTLERNGLLSMKDNHIETNAKGFFDDISTDEQKSMSRFTMKYQNLRGNELIGYVYNKYPYYATKSKISQKFISSEKLEPYRALKNNSALYTIGYEGKKFEQYLNELIQEDIKILVDVRKNAHSMKYGFSKKTLQNAVENLGIKYIHIPNLGIESENRQTLETKADYDALFAQYAKTFKTKVEDMAYLNELIENEHRVAITCFENDVSYCHRGVIAKKMKSNFKVEVHHL
jgi:uncharacterized protein (DUF488 family)